MSEDPFDQSSWGNFTELREGWKILLGSLIGLAFGAPILAFYTIGIFSPYMAAEFHWSFAFILSGLLIANSSLLPLAVVVGRLVDVFGPRMVGFISLILYGMSFGSLALGTGYEFQYLASWIAIGITGSAASGVTFTRAVNGHFSVNRGLALGIVLAGSGGAVIILKLISQPLIDSIGWRSTLLCLGAIPALFSAPIVLMLLKDSRPFHSGKRMADALPGLTLSQSLSNWRFWALFVSIAPVVLVGSGVIPNIERILRLNHLDPENIPLVASVSGFAVVLGRLGGGYAVDRIWAPIVAYTVTVLAAVGLVLLAQTTPSFGVAVIAVGLVGVAMGVELDLMAYMITRYFGLKSYAQVFGVLLGCSYILSGIGPSALAASFDQFGSYGPSLHGSALSMLVCGLLVLILGKYPTFTAPDQM